MISLVPGIGCEYKLRPSTSRKINNAKPRVHSAEIRWIARDSRTGKFNFTVSFSRTSCVCQCHFQWRSPVFDFAAWQLSPNVHHHTAVTATSKPLKIVRPIGNVCTRHYTSTPPRKLYPSDILMVSITINGFGSNHSSGSFVDAYHRLSALMISTRTK